MTQIEKEALSLFKDYTHLQLKSFKMFMQKEGATPYEQDLIDKALEYHSEYLSIKLNGKKGQLRKDGLF